MDEIISKPIFEIVKLVKNREISATEVTKSFIKKIESDDKKIHAFINFSFDSALEKAKEIDKKIAKGEKTGLLAGVPLAIKDNICIKGEKTTCGSRILSNFVSPYNATVIEKLFLEDAIFLGKTNLDEFAMGSSTENSYWGPTHNPRDLNSVPGGSSGGSAAAVANFECGAALGSDTGGSIRQPASFCGVVGLKPTYGRVSRYGLVAFASSLDQIGPLTKNVKDSALILKVIAGKDVKDSTSVALEVENYLDFLNKEIKGIKIGLPKEYFVGGILPEVKARVEQAAKFFSSWGAEIKEISLPHTEYALSAYCIIAFSEASSNLARYDGVKYGYRSKDNSTLIEMYKKTRAQGFGPEVKRRIMLGTYALSAGYYEDFYLKASKVRTLIKDDFINAFKEVDVILTPVSPIPAFKIGEKITDPLQMYLADVFTVPINLAGLPAISLPAGVNSAGLPLGIQLISPHFQEGILFQIGQCWEEKSEL